MRIHHVHEMIEIDNKKFLPKVLINRPGYRLVVLILRGGQSVPEHTTEEIVTVYAISGHITFYEGSSPFELRGGEVLSIDGGVPHRIEAREDSALLVVAAGNSVPAAGSILDLREVPRPERHPLVFGRLDALAVGESFELINDHDPIPLHRQIDATRPGQAEWCYLERRPEFFHIRVRRVGALRSAESWKTVQPEALLGVERQ